MISSISFRSRIQPRPVLLVIRTLATWIAVRPLPFPIPAGTKPTCTQNIGQIGARFAHHPSWHQPFLLSWMHVDKAAWNSLNAAQKAAMLRAAKDSVIESYNATESVECIKLKDILDFNDGINQRNADGTLRLIAGKPVSASMTMARGQTMH